MKKRHFYTSISKEKRIYEANIEKYKRVIENKCKKTLVSVPIISENVRSEPVASTTVQSLIPTSNANETDPTSSTSSINDVNKVDILSVLKQITEGQKEINNRLEKLEQDQTTILHNQSLLSNGQLVIVGNQKVIAEKLEKIEESIVSKPEMMAQSRLLMECKVIIKKVENSVCRMTGEIQDNKIDEVASYFPLNTLESVEEVEQKLQTPDISQAMTTYLHKLKGSSGDVSSVMREMFTDNLLSNYNWDGRYEKQALGKLTMVTNNLRDVFQEKGALGFDRSVRKAIERSHHRAHQKAYLRKEK